MLQKDARLRPGAGEVLYRLGLAHNFILENDRERALAILDDCPRELRGWEWYYCRSRCGIERIFEDAEIHVTVRPDHRRGRAAFVEQRPIGRRQRIAEIGAAGQAQRAEWPQHWWSD